MSRSQLAYLLISIIFYKGFGQYGVHNTGVVYISPGTSVASIQDFDNRTGSSFTNDGFLNVGDDFYVRAEVVATNNGEMVVVRRLVNSFQLINNPGASIRVGGLFRLKSGDEVFNNGLIIFEGDFRNRGNYIESSTGTSRFEGNFVQRIYSGDDTLTSVEFNNLVINNTGVNKGVQIEENAELSVKGVLTLTNGDLRLIDEAQLVQGLTSTVVATNGSLLRDRQGIASAQGYNYMSSPVNTGGSYSLVGNFYDGTDAGVNAFTPQNVQFNNGSPYNGLPSTLDGGGNVTTPLTINKFWLHTYLGNGAYSQWQRINESITLTPGTGFTMKGTGAATTAQNYTYKGEPNNGDYSFNVPNGQSALLGNPYPSALDADAFITDNSAVDRLLFWVDGGSNSHYLADYYGGYAIRNLTTGAPPSVIPSMIAGLGSSATTPAPGQYVAVGQGFFVESVSNDDITFTNAQRIAKREGVPADDSNFYRGLSSSNFDPNKKTIVRIGYEDPEGFHRQLALGFVPNSPASLGYDPSYDAKMIGTRNDDMYFDIEGVEEGFVIQGVGSFNNDLTFPVTLQLEEGGSHKILLDALENFDGPVYLYDRLSQINYPLHEIPALLEMPGGLYEDRFEIAFVEQSEQVLGDEYFDTAIFKVYFNEGIVINNPESVVLNKIEIFNVTGQLISAVTSENQLNRASSVLIPFEKAKGIYIVKIVSENKQYSFKILN
ncbi:hypothetical protein KH5_05820 [Urechidicola sp. KH5]